MEIQRVGGVVSKQTYTESTALVVVDCQNDSADPEGSLYVSGVIDVAPPASTKTNLTQRLNQRARDRWPDPASIEVRRMRTSLRR